MYDGKQVVRIVNNYKSKDLYNIGQEMTERIGTGNYDIFRNKYNVDYKKIKERNLYQEVKVTLESRSIEYLNKSKTNMLNGITFTSGPEFFKSLGMPFKNSDRFYQSGDKKGQRILIPDIKSKNDIPDKVTKYFDSCMEFLKNLVGEENIIMAQVHYDEDTPHLQAYFIPVVNEVKRKSYKRNEQGELIKEKVISNGNEKLVPILRRDNNDNIIYETVKGKFLNNDQFWKDLGGKNSFASVQDSFNKFINNKGFKLDRGEIGSNKKHTDKLEYKIKELKAELDTLYQTKINYYNDLNNVKDKLQNDFKTDIDIKKNIVGYSSKDVDKLIDYSKSLEQLNSINNKQLEDNKKEITSLKSENDRLKNNSDYLAYRYKYKTEIEEKDNEIKFLYKAINTITEALDIKLNRRSSNNINDYLKLSKEIKNANKHINDEMDESAKDFHKLFETERT